AWLKAQLPKISGKSPLAAAIRYALSRLPRLRPYLQHGILEIDNNVTVWSRPPCTRFSDSDADVRCGPIR
ncbi:MAG: transposase, partial [Donghicola eburneus]